MSPALRRIPLKYLLDRLDPPEAHELDSARNKAASLYAGSTFPPLVAAARRADLESDGDLTILAGRSWLLAAQSLQTDGADLDRLIGTTVTCTVVDLNSLAIAALRSGHPHKHIEEIGALIQAMLTAGEEPGAVARQLGTNVAAIRRLAAVATLSPFVLSEFGKGRLTFEQLVAFTLTESHAAQDALLKAGRTDPWQVRRWLHQAPGPATSDRRFLLVGQADYCTAGGRVFQKEGKEGPELWVSDVGLLERLAVDRLTEVADGFKNQGWAWLEIHTAFSFEERTRLKDAPRVKHEPPPEGAALLQTMREELSRLNEEYDRLDPQNDEHGDRSIEIENARARLEKLLDEKEGAFWQVDSAARQFAGVVVTISKRGLIEVHQGLVRPEDEAGLHEHMHPAPDAYADGPRALAELQRSQMLALQAALGAKPGIALRLLVHSLLSQLHYQNAPSALLELTVSSGEMTAAASRAKNSWNEQLPVNQAKLWEWLAARDDSAILEIIAQCVAMCLVVKPTGRASISHVQAVCAAVGLDMARVWAPTPEFLTSASRASLENAVTEAAGHDASAALSGEDDSSFRDKAGEILTRASWVPPYFRPRLS